MSISDHVGESIQDQARRALFERSLRTKKKLLQIKLSLLDMTGEEFCSYMRIMGQAYGFLGTTPPTEDDIVLFEKKIQDLNKAKLK